MYKMKIIISDGSEKMAEIEKPELIYGATALMLEGDYKENTYAINPVTGEKIRVIKGNKNKFIVPLHNKQDYKLSIKYNLPRKLAVMPYFTGEGESSIKEGINTVRRHSLIAIIEDKQNKKFLCEDMQKGKYRSFVQGGIEEGETIEQAAKREILEETGYKNVKIEYISEIPIINHFFAAYKGANGTNRFAKLEIVYGVLDNLDKDEISDEEKLKHTVKWVSKKELKDFININHNLYALNTILSKINVFEGEGIIISKDENNEKKSKEARKMIIDNFM